MFAIHGIADQFATPKTASDIVENLSWIYRWNRWTYLPVMYVPLPLNLSLIILCPAPINLLVGRLTSSVALQWALQKQYDRTIYAIL